MAKDFKTQFECDECMTVGPIRSVVSMCHVTEPNTVFVCEFCRDVYDNQDEARKCCAALEQPKPVEMKPRPPVKKPVPRPRETRQPVMSPQHSVVHTALQYSAGVIRKPVIDCEWCGVAQSVGRVIYCRCMI